MQCSVPCVKAIGNATTFECIYVFLPFDLPSFLPHSFISTCCRQLTLISLSLTLPLSTSNPPFLLLPSLTVDEPNTYAHTRTHTRRAAMRTMDTFAPPITSLSEISLKCHLATSRRLSSQLSALTDPTRTRQVSVCFLVCDEKLCFLVFYIN